MAVLLGLVIGVAGSLAEEPVVQPLAPKLVCKQPAYDFGVVDSTCTVRHAFVLWNEGNATLTVSRVRACCGATAQLSRQCVPPGENADVDVTYILANRQGKVAKSLYVESNDPHEPHYQLRLTGESSTMFEFSPQSVDLGVISSDTVTDRVVTLTLRKDLSLRVTNATVTLPHLTVSCETQPGSNRCHIVLRTAPPLPPGAIKGEVRLATDDRNRALTLPVYGVVASDVTVMPSEVVLTEGKGSEGPVTRYVAVRSRRAAPFKVLAVEPPDPGIEAQVTALTPSSYRIELRGLTPARVKGKELRITTDAMESPEIRAPFQVLK